MTFWSHDAEGINGDASKRREGGSRINQTLMIITSLRPRPTNLQAATEEKSDWELTGSNELAFGLVPTQQVCGMHSLT